MQASEPNSVSLGAWRRPDKALPSPFLLWQGIAGVELNFSDVQILV